jgi:hypothetical protein
MNSSMLIDNSLEVLNLKRLFFKLNRFTLRNVLDYVLKNILTILSSIMNIIGVGTYMTIYLTSTRIFTLIMNKLFIRTPKNYEESDYNLNLDLPFILY